ncbi:hypothetical protein E4U41_004318 [Claviceps citrina]|nr:hypothetical protein E4U41_004318 [Claviceps citrina]
MSFDGGTAYTESDADDEYERSMGDHSPVGDSEASPIDSELSTSTEHTATTYGGRRVSSDRSLETVITEWTAEECADFVSTIGLPQYADSFVENEIVGEALVALHHEDLKSMGIASVGHRLSILKSVYDVKKAQDVPSESDHYSPLSADTEAQYATATLKDIKHLVEQLRLRDERINLLEQDLRRMTDDFRRLREDMLPALRLVKDQQTPLPSVSSVGSGHGYLFEATISPPPAPTPPPGSGPGGVKRQYSQRKILIGATTKNASPTQVAMSDRSMSMPEQGLDPSSAAERAVLSSSSAHPSPNMPSPTSPQHYTGAGATLASRSYRGDSTCSASNRSTLNDFDHGGAHTSRDKAAAAGGGGGPPRRRETPVPDTPITGPNGPSVEFYKKFRVGLDDPCHRVLPFALRKYNISPPWDNYGLYIVYGNQERCLTMDEKPLSLFKQLEKEGKKPMFMLRKTTNAQVDGEAGGAGVANAAKGESTGRDPPGGII